MRTLVGLMMLSVCAVGCKMAPRAHSEWSGMDDGGQETLAMAAFDHEPLRMLAIAIVLGFLAFGCWLVVQDHRNQESEN